MCSVRQRLWRVYMLQRRKKVLECSFNHGGRNKLWTYVFAKKVNHLVAIVVQLFEATGNWDSIKIWIGELSHFVSFLSPVRSCGQASWLEL
jgi:hypothetical protein